MKSFFEKRLKVYTHEFNQFLWLAAVFFFIFFVTGIFRNYVDTSFLKRYGPEHIPLMLFINGLLTFLVLGVSDRLARKWPEYGLLAGVLIIYAGSGVALFFTVRAGQELAYPILFQLLYLEDSVFVLYLWNMAGDMFDARQGRRVFPLVTASQVLGTSLGNFATRPLTALIGQDQSLLVFAGACLLMGLFLFRTSGRWLSKPKVSPSQAKLARKRLVDVPGIMKRYPIIRFLIIAGLLPSLLLPIFNYQFSVIANNTYDSEQALISFLGYFRGLITLLTFVLLFVMGRLYSRMGLANASLAFPLNYALLFGLLTFHFNIFVAAYGQFSVRLIQRAIYGPVTKVLFSIIPGDLVKWSRTFVRGTVVKVGMLLGAAMMIVLKPVFDPQQLAPLAGLIALYWVVEAVIFGRRYRRGLKQVIVENQIDFDQIERLRTFDCEGAVQVGPAPLDDRTEEIQPEVACAYMDPDQALKLLEDQSVMNRAEAAASFFLSRDPRAVRPLILHLDDDEVVRNAAIDSLIAYTPTLLPFLEASLVRAPLRVQRGILEVIRLAKVSDFEMRPFVGHHLFEAYSNLVCLHALEDQPDSLGLDLLKTHLENKNQEILSLVFHALWVSHADMRLMHEALMSETAAVAVEMVEASLDKPLIPYIIPLIEEIPLQEKINRGRKLYAVLSHESLNRVLTLLAHRDDPVTRMLAAYYIGQQVCESYFIPTIEDLLEDQSPHVRQAAQYALARCYDPKEVAQMPEIIARINQLKMFSIFEGMGVRELHAIASVSSLEAYRPGDVLIAEGDENLAIYLIVKGQVKVYSGYETPEQREKATIGPGTFVGELTLFSSLPTTATCVAGDEVETLVIRHHQFQEIMKIYPLIGINLCRFFTSKLRQTTY